MEELEPTPILEEKPKKIWKQLAIILTVIVLAVIIAVVVSQTCFTTFVVEGDSMYPTLDGGVHGDLLDGEKLILNKVAKVKRGDIIVFTPVGWTEIQSGKSLVKRVIAIGGDTISIKDNKVYLNGSVLNEPYINSNTLMKDMDEFKVPENEYFCMGDNRNQSLDCRISLKAVKEDEIIGRCWLIKNQKGKLRHP